MTDPITLTIPRDCAWPLGLILLAGVWILTTGAVWWASDVARATHHKYKGVRTWN